MRLVLLVAVTGLVHFVVFGAMREHAVFETRETHNAPVTDTKTVKVLAEDAEYDGPIVVEDVLNLLRSKRLVASQCDKNTPEPSSAIWFFNWFNRWLACSGSGKLNIGGDALRNDRSIVGLVGKYLAALRFQLREPCLRIGSGAGPNKYLSTVADIESRGFAEVDEGEVGFQPLGSFDSKVSGSGGNFVAPYIGPLVAFKLFRIVGYALASQQALEGRESGGQQEQSGGYFSPKKLTVLVGFIIALGGFILLSKVLDKVYLCPGFNVNVAVGGFFLAAVLVWLGLGMVLHALGFLFCG